MLFDNFSFQPLANYDMFDLIVLYGLPLSPLRIETVIMEDVRYLLCQLRNQYA